MPASATPTLVSTREKLLWAAPVFGLSAASFLYVDARNAALTASSSTLPLETAVDAWLPFIPHFVFAYILYYPWLLLPLRVLQTRESFFRCLGAFVAMQLIAEAVFVLYPSHIVRPVVVGSGLSETLLRSVYGLDVGWNLFPSLHVGHSVLVALVYRRYARRGVGLVWLGTFLISASTVLIKQHFFVDILAGAALAGVCYFAAWRALPAVVARLRALDSARVPGHQAPP